MASLYSLLCVATILLSSVRFNNGEAIVPQHKALFVFGDSLFDAGNNLYLAIFTNSTKGQTSRLPYGETYFKHPTGRFSDGRIVPDFIAQFMNMSILDPYLKPGATNRLTDGANFACAGAGVLDQDSSYGSTIHLPEQVSRFKEAANTLKKTQGEKEANRILSSAVYLLSIGGNDYFKLYQSNLTPSDQDQYVRTVIGNLTNNLKEIYGLGGRKIAFQDVGPLGCTPILRSFNTNGSCIELVLALAIRHNRYLNATLQELQSKLSGFKYAIFDYYGSIKDRVDNPSKYGFKEGKTACCGSGAYRASGCAGGSSGNETFETCSKPSEYVWWDLAHSPEAANHQLAQLIWSGSSNTTRPYNVKQLFESS